ncbi:hypothetical protein IW261DRAFT_1449756 [Armillaria novae-zelandiae]|uniref:Secreted protein n=1 Tax=Armillaria novae-zelandiae TaxID=153914 RepID=A0AA39PNV4_9AGAR|nr:hypothetical protein IW261DRAFT_1449756 [Armillaria novae-zelandiae]
MGKKKRCPLLLLLCCFFKASVERAQLSGLPEFFVRIRSADNFGRCLCLAQFSPRVQRSFLPWMKEFLSFS